MDLVLDTLGTGRHYRVLIIVDYCDCWCPHLEPGTTLTGRHVAEVLEHLCDTVGLPRTIVVDNGAEFISRVMLGSALDQDVRLHFIQSGKPTQNAFVESFNGRLRAERLNLNWFEDLADARAKLEAWRVDFNSQWPHIWLGNITPGVYRREALAAGNLSEYLFGAPQHVT